MIISVVSPEAVTVSSASASILMLLPVNESSSSIAGIRQALPQRTLAGSYLEPDIFCSLRTPFSLPSVTAYVKNFPIWVEGKFS